MWSPSGTSPSNETRSPFDVRALDRNDGIGALRQRRAGGDRHGRVRLEAHRIVAGERSPGDRQLLARVGLAHRIAVHRRVVEGRQVVRRVHVGGDGRGPTARCSAGASRPGAASTRSSSSAQRLVPGAGVGDSERPRAYAINGRVDDGPVAPAAVHSPSGPALDAACRAIAALPPHPALAGPAWWDAGAPQRRVTHVRREAQPLPAAPWPPRRALDFCGELALALAPVHEAGAAHGALRPAAVEIRPDGGPLVHVPLGDAGPADDVHGLGVLLLHLLTGRSEHEGLVVAGEAGAAAEAAALLQSMLAPDPAARPGSARQVAARLGEIAADVPGHDALGSSRAQTAPEAGASRHGTRPARRGGGRGRVRARAPRRPGRAEPLARDGVGARCPDRHAREPRRSAVLRGDHDLRRCRRRRFAAWAWPSPAGGVGAAGGAGL